MIRSFNILGFGFLIWVVPFSIGMVLILVISPESTLFDTLMSVSLALAATTFSYFFFKRESERDFSAANVTLIGAIWFVLAIVFDAPVFLLSNLTAMSVPEYFADIGLAYLSIPIIAFGVGRAFAHARSRNPQPGGR